MLANLRNIFNPQAIAETLTTLTPIETVVMDTFFKNRPTHPSSMIGISDLTQTVHSVPLVRRDGTPLSLKGDSYEAQFIAPLPIKVQINVSASELNDLRAMMSSPASIEQWRRNKMESIRNTARLTTEGLSATVLTQGKVNWPVSLEGGRTENYEVDYGRPHTYSLSKKLTIDSTPSELYGVLREMGKVIKKSGIGGTVEFYAGSDVVDFLIDFADKRHSVVVNEKQIKIELSSDYIIMGKFKINFLDDSYPDPLSPNNFVDILDAKTLMAVATSQTGKVWYCATDSISANNAPTPMHIVPVARADDSGYTLIGQTKPLPARTPKGTCLCVLVD